MSDDDTPHQPDAPGGDERDEFDEMARRAGSDLRRPAPPDGLAAVERSKQRHQVLVGAGAGAAVVLLVGGLLLLVNRGNDDDTVLDTPPAASSTLPMATSPTTQPTTTQPPTTQPPTTEPPTTQPPTTQPPTTQPPTTQPPTTQPPTTQPPTTQPPTTQPTTTEPPPTAPVSDEVLPDPANVAGDGIERRLVDRTIVVGTDSVIPLDLPERELILLGVGDNGVAYIRAADGQTTRLVGVPTTPGDPFAGTVYELVAPFEAEGPWTGLLNRDNVRLIDNLEDRFSAFIGPDGQDLVPADDPSLTWEVQFRNSAPGRVMINVVSPEGTLYTVPVDTADREGLWDRWTRPLPDGRVVVTVLDDDGVALDWALTPSTGEWVAHARS